MVSEIAGYLDILRSRPRLHRGAARRTAGDQGAQFADPRRTTIEDVEFEADIEALIQREDDGRDGQPCRLHQARAAVDLSRAAPRRPRPRGHGDPRGRFPQRGLRRLYPSRRCCSSPPSGRVYKLKVYRLPLGTPQARGRPMVNLLPNLATGETISTVMPLPEDEERWADLHRHVRDRQRLCPAQRAVAISATCAPTARSR